MRTLSLFILLLLFGCQSNPKERQSESISEPITIEAASLIPEGYVLTDSIGGDLTSDGINEFALMISEDDDSNVTENEYGDPVNNNRRGILIFSQVNEKTELLSQNLSCFSASQSDGMYMAPELYVEISDNTLIVNYANGRYGYWNYTFKYQNSAFELIKYFNSSSNGPVTDEETVMDFMTMKMTVKTNTNPLAQMEGEEEFEEATEEIKAEGLVKLSEIDDFDSLFK